MDWQEVSALCAVAVVFGGGLGWISKHMYSRGRLDGTTTGADIATEANIGRLSLAVDKLTDGLNAHIKESEGRFSHLETIAKINGESMNQASTEMRELTKSVASLTAMIAKKQ